jgi:ketosteroid isomerase-like protein
MDDYEAIRQLIYGYPKACDAADFDGLAHLFRHAELSMTLGGTKLSGPEQIREWWQREMRLHEDGKPLVRHYVTNICIDVAQDGQTASADSYYITFQRVRGAFPLQPIISGEYHDRFDRDTDGSWQFAARVFQSDMVGDTSYHLFKKHPLADDPG